MRINIKGGKMLGSKKGFTAIEAVIVIAIVAMAGLFGTR